LKEFQCDELLFSTLPTTRSGGRRRPQYEHGQVS